MNRTPSSPGPGGRLAELGARYPDFVRRACMRYVQNRDEADDLAQEVLLKASVEWESYAGASRPATWLYRVAANHCLDHLRRRKRQARAEASEFYEIEAPEESLCCEPAMAPYRMTYVLERLRTSPDAGDRHLVHLRFDLDLPQAGIAKRLGVSRTVVGRRLARIHSRAATLLEEFS